MNYTVYKLREARVIVQILAATSLVALLIAIYNWLQTRALNRRMSVLLADIDEKSLQEALALYYLQVRKTDSKLSELLKGLAEVAAIADASSQKLSIVRFNPFGDTGGDQSFTMAMLNGHDSGFILTSMHGREGTRIYIKPVDQSRSSYPLSKEEQQALEQALKR
jgi:hypothetical protein